MTLVVLFAGKSKRYGSLKQYEVIDNNNHFIVDYNLEKAIKYGFKKVIFVLRLNTLNLFKKTIYKRYSNKIDINYVIQPFYSKGTTQAITLASSKTNDYFLTINGDDLYSDEVFEKAIDINKPSLFVASLNNTFFKESKGNRGIIKKDSKNNLIEIKEESIDYKINSSFNPLISINSFILNKDIATIIKNSKELIICNAINELLKLKIFNFEVIEIKNKVYGLTYKEDKEFIINYIKNNN